MLKSRRTWLLTSSSCRVHRVRRDRPGPRARRDRSNGPQGSPGANYTIQTTLQSGQTETGVYAVLGEVGSQYFGGAFDYRVPLAAPLDLFHVVFNANGGTSAHCPGPGSAVAGDLCVYEAEGSNRDSIASSGLTLLA